MTNEDFKSKLVSFKKKVFVTIFIVMTFLAIIWSPFFTYTEEENLKGIFVNLGFTKYSILIQEEN